MGKYISVMAFCLMMAPAYAGEIGNFQAGSIQVGSFRGIVYYTSAHDGYRLVATIAQGEAGLPVRFEVTLMDAQKVTISVPGKAGERSHVLEMSRTGDKVVFRDPQPIEDGNLEIADSKP